MRINEVIETLDLLEESLDVIIESRIPEGLFGSVLAGAVGGAGGAMLGGQDPVTYGLAGAGIGVLSHLYTQYKAAKTEKEAQRIQQAIDQALKNAGVIKDEYHGDPDFDPRVARAMGRYWDDKTKSVQIRRENTEIESQQGDKVNKVLPTTPMTI